MSAAPYAAAESPLITFTLFADIHPTSKDEHADVTWPDFVSRLRVPTTYLQKSHCKLISLCEYGNEFDQEHKCLRYRENVRRAFGTELDYDGALTADGKPMSPKRAAAILADARILAAIYTTPSHTDESPRWRAVLPFSEPALPEKRAEYLARANRLLGGIASRESFTLSQSFYIGRVRGVEYVVLESSGRCIDLAADLEPLYHISSTNSGESRRDETTDENLRAAFGRGENRYFAMLKLSARWAARGMAVDDIEANLHALLGDGSLNADGIDLKTRCGPMAQSAFRKYGDTRRRHAEHSDQEKPDQGEHPDQNERHLNQPAERTYKIEIKAGEAARALAELSALMPVICESEQLMVYGGLVTHPYTVEREGFHEKTVEVLALNVLSARALASHMDTQVHFAQWKQFKDGPVKQRTDCPDKLVQTLLDRADLIARIPVQVRGLAMTPVWRAGELVSTAGYDRVSKMWITAPTITLPEHLTHDDARKALAYLQGWLSEFKFADERSAAAGVGLLLTAAMRASLPHCPMFVVNKHEHGEGGSTLCTLATIVQTGREPAVICVSADDSGHAEIEKRIDAAQIAGEMTLCLDNWKSGGVVSLTSLATIVSESERKVRVLGLSKNITCPNSQLVLVNGRNITVADDFIRRSVEIALDTKMAAPDARTFKRPEIIAEAMRDRAQILTACYSIVAAYHHNRPSVPVTARAGFNHWVRTIAAALKWLGLPDIAEVPADLRAADPELGYVTRLLPAWAALCQAAKVDSLTVAGAISSNLSGAAEVHAVLAEVTDAKVFEGKPQLKSKAIGYFLRRVAGRRIENMRLVAMGRPAGSVRWGVESLP